MPTFSRLMLGTVQFGLPYGIANSSGMPSDEEILAILKEAFQAGVDSLDTSADYDCSEERLGNAMERLGFSDRFHVVTKIPKVPDGFSEEKILAFLEEHLVRSLKRLKITRLAAALFHSESDAVYLPLLKTFRDRGLIELEGVSLNSMEHPEEVQNASCVQIPSNIFDHRFDFLIESAPQRQRRVFARSAFLQGAMLLPRDKIPPYLSALIPYLKELDQIADESGYSLKHLAIGYLFSQPEITSVVVGVETAKQMQENIRIVDEATLPNDLLTRLKKLAVSLPASVVQPSLWKKN